MLEALRQPWPWYVGGPLIGLFVPGLLYMGNRMFGISSSLRHVCAATVPGRSRYLRYDWKGTGLWNLVFVVGVVLGGLVAGTLLADPSPLVISDSMRALFTSWGFAQPAGLVPTEIFSWAGLATVPGFVMLVVGGFLVGFGARWADGCTSGHAIMGLSNLQLPSLIAVVGFFAGGLLATHVLLPVVLG